MVHGGTNEVITSALTDPEILAEIGRRIRRLRMEADLTIKGVAAMARVSPLTVGRLERGGPVTTETLLRVLRTLRKVEYLDALLPDPGPSPLALLEAQRATRPRVRVHRKRVDPPGEKPRG